MGVEFRASVSFWRKTADAQYSGTWDGYGFLVWVRQRRQRFLRRAGRAIDRRRWRGGPRPAGTRTNEPGGMVMVQLPPSCLGVRGDQLLESVFPLAGPARCAPKVACCIWPKRKRSKYACTLLMACFYTSTDVFVKWGNSTDILYAFQLSTEYHIAMDRTTWLCALLCGLRRLDLLFLVRI